MNEGFGGSSGGKDKGAAPLALSGQVEALGRRGFVHLEEVLSLPTIGELSRFIYDKLDENIAVWNQHTGVDWTDSQAMKSYVASLNQSAELNSDMKHLARGELPLAVRLAPELRTIAHEAGLVEILQEVLGEREFRMHNPPSIRAIAPHQTSGSVPPHQDWAYNRHMKSFVSVWVPLCEIDEECGGVDLFEGSQTLGPVRHEDINPVWTNTADRTVDLSSFPVVHHAMKPGDALLFGPHTVHTSRGNSSRRVRCSIDFRFFGASTPSTKHYYDVTRQVVVSPNH